jgi:hypothetical protein
VYVCLHIGCNAERETCSKAKQYTTTTARSTMSVTTTNAHATKSQKSSIGFSKSAPPLAK